MTKTKRVRIIVAMGADGEHCAVELLDGQSVADAPRVLNDALRFMKDGDRISVVEADVPMPEDPAVVRGEVVDD